MQKIPQSFIQDVVARTDIVGVIQSRIDLKKRGNTHVACCPFHNEKTPSFTVSQVKQFYYCFGCGAHGNVIGFLMEYDHLPFVEAITDLAHQLGLTIPVEKNDDRAAEFDVLYRLLYDAQTQYENELKKSATAIAYLKNRGLTGNIAKKFGVGFAPDAWEFLAHTAKEKRALMTAGMLVEKNPGHYYDRFRNRVMFPIRDVRGRTVAFGGRTLTDEIPKYLNSPETPVFYKNQMLYGLYEMCQNMRKIPRALIVEGYLDVISLSQHDIHYAVATLGTAFNAKHVQLLLRYTSDIVFSFDGDAAGRKAAWKALTLSLPLLRDGINLRVLFLPAAEDPDSLVRKIGKAAFEKLIDESHTLSTVFFEELEKEFPCDTIAGKAAFAKQANDHLNTMPEGIYKNLMLDELAKRLSIKREKITAKQNNSVLPKTAQLTTRLNPAQLSIQLLLHHPEFHKLISESLLMETLDTVEKKFLIELVQRYENNIELTINELLSDIQDINLRALIASIATFPLHIPIEGRKAELLDALKRIQVRERTQKLTALIEQAKKETLTDDEKKLLQTLLLEKQQIA